MQLQINVPNSLNEISLKKYQAYVKTQESSNDDEFVAQKMIEIFCDIQLKDIVKIKISSINELILHFSSLFKNTPKFQPTFKIGEIEFGFIPELEEITFGEYVDLEANLKSWSNFHKAMAVMYRPITQKKKEKYDIQPYNPNPDMQDLMKFAPLDVCIGASVFFCNLEIELLKATLNYLSNQIEKSPEVLKIFQKQLNLPNNGDGINRYTRLLKEMYADSMRWQNYDLLNASRFLRLRGKKTKSKKDNLKDN